MNGTLICIISSSYSTLFVAQGNTVLVFSVKTGELVNRFEPAQNTIVQLEFKIHSTDTLIGCTETGQIVIWNIKKGSIEERIELEIPKSSKISAFSLFSVSNDESTVQAIVVYRTNSRQQILDVFDTKTGAKGTSHFHHELTMAKVILKVSHNLNAFALVQNNLIYVVDLASWKSNKLKNASKQRVTCLDFHPEEEIIATGDVTGKIFIWRKLYETFPLTSLYHWHHTQVNTVHFTESGLTLYSSGNEGVLVSWDLSKRDKSFLPRLPSNGVQMAICPRSSQLAVSLEDNSILIINDKQIVETTLQLFSYVPKSKTNLSNFPIGFKLNPRNKSILYNGRRGQIQFVSTYTKSLMYNVSNFCFCFNFKIGQ